MSSWRKAEISTLDPQSRVYGTLQATATADLLCIIAYKQPTPHGGTV